MMILDIMKDHGWTYEEYMSQPSFIIELAQKKKRIDNVKADQERKKAERHL